MMELVETVPTKPESRLTARLSPITNNCPWGTGVGEKSGITYPCKYGSSAALPSTYILPFFASTVSPGRPMTRLIYGSPVVTPGGQNIMTVSYTHLTLPTIYSV